MQRGNTNHSQLGGSLNIMSSEGILGQSQAVFAASKMYEDRMKHTNANTMNSETSQPLLDAKMALLKSASNHSG